MARILVVEDAKEFHSVLKAIFGSRVELDFAQTASAAYTKIIDEAYDLILTDVGLPDEDGLSLVARIRELERARDIPVIFLVGRCDLSGKERGFSLGAEDYIVKPFDPRELAVRVEAKLAKYRNGARQSEWMRKGPLKISTVIHRVVIEENGVETDLDLTPLEFKLLNILARNEGRTMSRERLLGGVWGNGVHVVSRTIDKHICGLRAKLRGVSESVQTVPGQGYRFSLQSVKKAA